MRIEALSRLIPGGEEFVRRPPSEPVVWRQSADLPFTLEKVDELLDHGSLQRQMVSLVKGGKRIAPAAYTWAGQPIQPGFADVARNSKLSAYAGDGATMVLESLHRTWRPIGDLCRRLSWETGVPVSANAYLTPSDSQGFAHHYDTHSVLIVQTAGSKTWQLHAPVHTDPLEHQPFNGQSVSEAEWDRLRNAEPFLETTLQAGDSLWIPRGWIHNGFATADHSLHVSFSFPALTPYWVATELVKALGDEPAFRAELDWGFSRSRNVQVAAIEATAKLLAEQFARLDAGAQAEDLADRYRRYFLEAARQPVATNFFDEPGEQTPVRTVSESVCGITCGDDGSVRLHLGDSAVTFDAPLATAVAQLIEADSAEPWCAADLAAELGPGTAVNLVATLLRAGVVTRA